MKFLLRTIKIVIIIMNLSYFLGLTWLIICAGDLWFIDYLSRLAAESKTHHEYEGFIMEYCIGVIKDINSIRPEK